MSDALADTLASKGSTWSFVKLNGSRGSASSPKAATVSSSKSKHRSIVIDQDFFDETAGPDRPLPSSSAPEQSSHLSAILRDDSWEVSVAERRGTGKRIKNEEPAFTLYVTTAVTSLTLTRTRQELQDFDTSLRATTAVPFPSPLDNVFGAVARDASPPRKKRGPLLASLSKTLSPGKLRPSRMWHTPLAEIEPNGGARSPLSEVSAYLTALSKLPQVKSLDAWKAFFSAQTPNDLESHRVERRVRKMKSDSSVRLRSGRQISASDAGTPIMPATKGDDSASLKDMADLAAQFLGTETEIDTPMAPRKDREPSTDGQASTSAATQQVDRSRADLTVDLPPRPATAEPSPAETQARRRIELPVIVSVSEQARMRKAERKKTTLEDFEILRVLGRGCAGKVLLVRHHANRQLFAMKAIHKHHVLAHRELGHTLTEQSVLRTMAKEAPNPFIVKLYWSFHDKDSLFLVLDFHPGGDLATQLARWGRLGRDRTRFYSAEIAEGLTGLHEAGVIYRDLKPENVLIGADGHVVLTDFGLSKQFDRPARRSTDLTASMGPIGEGELALPTDRASWMPAGRSYSSPPESSRRDTCTTFCGTAEYLAPEVLLGEPYSYECDAWSFGTMLYEMLTGMTPFWATDHTAMYRRVLHDELVFEDDGYLDADTKSILRGLMQKNPLLRMSDSRIRRHPYFGMIDWSFIRSRRYIPPYVPALNPEDELDTSNFDQAFLSMTPVVIDPNEEPMEEADDDPDKEPKIPQSPIDENGNDVFCGYSFRGESDGEDEDSLPSFDETQEHDTAHPQHDSAYTTSDGLGSPPQSPQQKASEQMAAMSASISSELAEAGGLPSNDDITAALGSIHEGTPTHERTPTIEKELPTEPVVAEEEDWEKVENEGGAEARNGRRTTKGGTFWSRGISDKYVLAVRDAVRPPPKRASSRRTGGILTMRSRNGSRSSSSDNVNTLDSPSGKRLKNESGFLQSPLKMKMKASKTSLRSRPTNYSRRNSGSPTETLQLDPGSVGGALGTTPRPTRQNTATSEDLQVAKVPKSKLFGKRVSAMIHSKSTTDVTQIVPPMPRSPPPTPPHDQ